MAIIRWEPFSIDKFFEDDLGLPTIPGISRLAGQSINLYETDDAVIAEVAIPGIPEDKIDVTVDDDVVRVSGSQETREEDKGKRRYFMSSLNSSFNYAFRLPQGVVQDVEPTCELENGVLKMAFPKVEKKAPKKIKVTKKGSSQTEKVTAKKK